MHDALATLETDRAKLLEEFLRLGDLRPGSIMGHSQIDSTYWYLHATPHVLGQISDLSETLGKGGQS
jgi:hypothetical protein